MALLRKIVRICSIKLRSYVFLTFSRCHSFHSLSQAHSRRSSQYQGNIIFVIFIENYADFNSNVRQVLLVPASHSILTTSGAFLVHPFRIELGSFSLCCDFQKSGLLLATSVSNASVKNFTGHRMPRSDARNADTGTVYPIQPSLGISVLTIILVASVMYQFSIRRYSILVSKRSNLSLLSI